MFKKPDLITRIFLSLLKISFYSRKYLGLFKKIIQRKKSGKVRSNNFFRSHSVYGKTENCPKKHYEDQHFPYHVDLVKLRKVMDTPSFPQKLSQLQIRRVATFCVPGAEDFRPARLYVPYGVVQGLIIFLHGGGFVHGGFAAYHGICCRLARSSRAAVLSVEYRLAPEHPFPAAVKDVEALWQWVQVRLQRYPKQKIVAAGDSAGGNLAAVLAFKVRAEGKGKLAGQLLFYPSLSGAYAFPSRIRYAKHYMLTRRLMEWYGRMYLHDEKHIDDVDFAPLLNKDFSNLPPAVLIQAQFDPMRDEGRYYAAALHKAGVRVWYRCYGGTIHGFLNFYAFMPKAKRALRYGAQIARTLLKP